MWEEEAWKVLQEDREAEEQAKSLAAMFEEMFAKMRTNGDHASMSAEMEE